MNFSHFDTDLREIFAQHSDAPALMSPDGQVLTFARLGELVTCFASRLHNEGIRPGHCVIPYVDNSAMRMALTLALLRLGADVALMINPRALAQAAVKVDFVLRFADQAIDGELPAIIFSQDWVTPDFPMVPAAERQASVIFGTSGSTGLPKAVRFRIDRLMRTMQNRVEGSGISIGPALVGIPETTMFSFSMMLRAFLRGHGIMWMRGDAETVLEQAKRLGVREFMVTPPVIAELATAAEGDRTHPPVERIVIVGAIASRPLLQRVAAIHKTPIAIMLGSTEIGQTSFGLIDPATYVPGWSGKPISNVEVKIIDPVPESSGRILLRCDPWIGSEGYLGGEPIFDAEGWFDSGDVGRILPDGNLMIEGRADNLINLGGSKFAAELIEMLAAGSPGVRSVVAVRLPGNTGRAELGLAVVAEDGFDPEALRVLLGLKLNTRAPIVIRPVASIPMLPSGKIDRRAVLLAFQA